MTSPGRAASFIISLVLLLCVPVRAAEVADPEGSTFKWGQALTGDSGALGALNSTNTLMVTANSDWALALMTNGSLLAWGSNTYGQTNAPAGTDFVHAVAGWRHGIAARSGGGIIEWGTPFGETIGDWTNLWPAAMIAAFATDKVVEVAAGDDHSAARTESGIVYTWGGRSAVTNRNAEFTDVIMLASGWYNLLLLRTGGSITNFGQVSQTGQYWEFEEKYTTNAANIVYVNCSQWSSYAIDANGVGYGWGMPEDADLHLTFPANATNLVSLSGGRDHSVCARADGTVISFGGGTLGQDTTPSTVTNALWVSAGRFTSFAIQGSGEGGSSPPSASTFYVDKDGVNGTAGNDGNAGTSWETALATIQAGVDKTPTNGTVIIAPANYPEYITTKSNLVSIVADDAGVLIKALRVNDHTNIVLDGLYFEKPTATNTWTSQLRIENDSHNLTVQNCVFRSGPLLLATNWFISNDSNTVYASGVNWTNEGFQVGSAIYMGGISITNHYSHFANHDQDLTIVSFPDPTVAEVTGLTTETNFAGNIWAPVFVGYGNPGLNAIEFIEGGGTAATNATLQFNSISNIYGAAFVLKGDGHTVAHNTIQNTRSRAWIHPHSDNSLIISNLVLPHDNWVYYQPGDAFHALSGTYYDYIQGHIHTVSPGTNVVIRGNWLEGVDQPLGTISEQNGTTNWLWHGNVIVGFARPMGNGVNGTTFVSNTFYRCAYETDQLAILTVGGNSPTSPVTNMWIVQNAFIDNGDHSSPDSEGYYSFINNVNSGADSNFVASTETMAWAGPADLSESNGIKGQNPLIVNKWNPRGPDGIPFTADDGLRPLPTSPLVTNAFQMGALTAYGLTANTPVAHFTATTSGTWLDTTGYGYNPDWTNAAPFNRGTIIRPWTTDEVIGDIPLEIHFDARTSISGDWFTNSWKGIKRFHWSYGDGASDMRPMQSPTNSHVFLWPGTFDVVLTVENFAGNTHSVTQSYTVHDISSFMGDIFHVATNGNNTTGDGSLALPWLTIGKGYSNLVAGDYLAVHQGQYAEDLDMNRDVASSRISIHGFGAQTDRFRVRYSNWTIWGFDIDNTADGQGGVYAFQAADAGWIVNNKFHDINAGGLAGGIYGAGTPGTPLDNSLNWKVIGNWFTNVMEIQVQIFGGSNWLVSANYAENSDGEGDFIRPRGAKHVIQDNYVYNMNNGGGGGHPDFIQLDDQAGSGYWWLDLLVQRNWVESDPSITNGSDFAMGQIETGAFADSAQYTNMVLRNNAFVNVRATFSDSNDGMKFWNNTFFASPRESPNITSGGGVRGSSWGMRHTNNIFHQIASIPGPVSTSTGWYYRSTGSGNPGSNTTVYADFNLVYPAKTGSLWTENGNEGSGINGSDPDFADESILKLLLAPESPAYDAGIDLSGLPGIEGFTDDFWGETRTVWSIGAFEFSTAGAEAPPTTVPRVTIRGATFQGGVTLR